MASKIHINAFLVDDKGTWTVRARFSDPVSGKKKLHSKSTGLKVKGNNKRKAEAAMREIASQWERQVNRFVPVDNPKFKEYLKLWFEKKKLTIRANTLESYKAASASHIIPELGNIRICDMSRNDIQKYFEKMKRAGLSSSTMRKHRVIIHGALKDAVLDDIIPVNVADNVALPKSKKFEGKALSEKQVIDMLHRLDKQPEPVRAGVTLAVVCGLRRSEICGLRWSDVDFENNVLHVRNTVTEYSGVIYETEATKTRASCRDLYLIEHTANYLKQLKDDQKQKGCYTGKVCAHTDGRVVKPEYMTRACMRFLKGCGFDGVRLHDLRHTAATILAKRVPIKQVQAYLGHEDIQTTLGIYTHILSEDSVATSNAMGDFLETAGFSLDRSESVSESMDNIININIHRKGKLSQA